MARFNKKTETIRDLIDHRLKAVAAVELRDAPTESHIGEDTIAAYIEGRLAENECKPVLAHLAACGFCRRVSAQIVQLENQIDDEVSADVAEGEPGRLEALFSGLRSDVPLASEEVVFAYESQDANEERKEAEDSDD